ncbi:MAG: hypothetical protein HC820_04970 [Hydrococcus sp. RM1_1_31]|nr:hypothetical protein [Hydrococcus sp. RM1_1_31]
MMTVKKKSRYWVALALVCWLAIIGFDNITQAQTSSNLNSQLSRQIEACVPNSPPGAIAKIELVSQTKIKSKTYFYFYAYDEPKSPYPSNLVISVEAQNCHLEHFNPMNDPIPLAKTVPQQVARNLVFGRYQGEIKKIGLQGLQERVNSWASQSQGYVLWDEEQWALRQLNIQIPASLRKQ